MEEYSRENIKLLIAELETKFEKYEEQGKFSLLALAHDELVRYKRMLETLEPK